MAQVSSTVSGRTPEQLAYDAYLAECKSRQLLDTITDKWVTLVLCALAQDGESRYSELARRIAGVSQKMLTQTLKSLDRDGLVLRTVEATVPITVRYRLTPLGESLVELFLGIKDWAESHMDAVLAARQEHQALHPA